MKKKINVLSIDGGGIRGIIPAIILAYIEEKLQHISKNPDTTLADYFDLIAGTSTGGILACYYVLPPSSQEGCHSKYFANEAIKLYTERGKEIFNKKWYKTGITSELYSAEGLEKVLQEQMDEVLLSETRQQCLITAYDITKRKAVLFTTPEARRYPHRDYYMRDVARATSAAPNYFEPAVVRSLGGAFFYLIDGAMYAGNPTLCAIVEANKTRYDKCENPGIQNLYVVSVGTGKEKKKYDYEKAKDWGLIGWAKPVVDILLSASAEVVNYQVQQLFNVQQCPEYYARIEPDLYKAKPDMDDASDENIRFLQDAAHCYIRDNAEKLDQIAEMLVANF